jgi:cell division septal protein FtsQ
LGIDKTKRQRKEALRAMLIRLTTCAVLGTLIAGCFYAYDFLTTTDRLAISQVDYRGLNRLDRAEIDRMLADIEGQNILLVPLENYAARFAQHPRIRNADFRKVLPNRLICSFTEREPVALVYSSRFLEVDRDGMIMSPDDVTGLLDLPIITGLDAKAIEVGKPCEDRRIAWALNTLAICKRYGGRFADDISELKVGVNGISIVSLKEGVVLLLGSSEFESRLKRYFMMESTIAQQDEAARLIDLRFDDQIVLRNGI